MTWLLLGGGPTPALEPDARAATSQSTTNNISQLDEDDAAELDPRSRPVSPSITAVNDHRGGASAHAAHEPTVAFVNECAAQQQDAKDSRAMAESSCHALPRIMAECNVESFKDYDGDVDALPQNMETANIAPKAPVFDSAAADGAIIALEASLASESAGVFYISQCVLRTRGTQEQ
jgi:hypothetical protein